MRQAAWLRGKSPERWKARIEPTAIVAGSGLTTPQSYAMLGHPGQSPAAGASTSNISAAGAAACTSAMGAAAAAALAHSGDSEESAAKAAASASLFERQPIA